MKPLHVFISYKRDDGADDFIANLKSRLDAVNIPIWQDINNIELGDEWLRKIDEALDNCFILIAVITNNYKETVSCSYEWAIALGRKVLVLPVLPSHMDSFDLPLLLGRFQTVKFRGASSETWKNLINTVHAEYDRVIQEREKKEKFKLFSQDIIAANLETIINNYYLTHLDMEIVINDFAANQLITTPDQQHLNDLYRAYRRKLKQLKP